MVGGGLVGTSMAYELVAAGADTVLVDRHDPGCVTDAGAGILSPETSGPRPARFAVAMAVARHYPILVERLAEDGATESGFAVTGSLLVAERPGDDQVMETAAALVERRCPGLVEEVGPTEASRHFPPLGTVRRALYSPAGRRVYGRAAECRSALGGPVPGPTGDGRRCQRSRCQTDPGSVNGVLTARRIVATDAVVICGGSWSTRCPTSSGVASGSTPLKGQIIHLGPAFCRQPERTASSSPYSASIWFPGRTAGSPTAGPWRPMPATTAAPLPTACTSSSASACVRPRAWPRPPSPMSAGCGLSSVDGRPVLGRVPGWANAFVATGHGAEGLLLSTAESGLVARQVPRRRPPADGHQAERSTRC